MTDQLIISHLDQYDVHDSGYFKHKVAGVAYPPIPDLRLYAKFERILMVKMVQLRQDQME
jgi:hypothetical protein